MSVKVLRLGVVELSGLFKDSLGVESFSGESSRQHRKRQQNASVLPPNELIEWSREIDVHLLVSTVLSPDEREISC